MSHFMHCARRLRHPHALTLRHADLSRQLPATSRSKSHRHFALYIIQVEASPHMGNEAKLYIG